VVLAVRHGVSKTVKRLPLTVQDLTTQASNEFIPSYLQAQPRLVKPWGQLALQGSTRITARISLKHRSATDVIGFCRGCCVVS
jgi:hypothetical protein